MSTKKGDFIELVFTGKANGQIFDSNILEDMKKIDSEAKPRQLKIIIGQGMVVKGLDKYLEEKEINTPYTVNVGAQDGFGARSSNLVKTIPLHVFTSQKINPESGMTLALDNMFVHIRAVSGARVIADFNNPLAGKDLEYTFTIVRKIEEVEEKTRVFFEWFLRTIPEFEISDKVTVKGPANLEPIINFFKQKFSDLIGKELSFSVQPQAEKIQEEGKAQQQSL